ncbi:hypothetical protein PJ311_13695 [Bacillus sp. CLL-7-23]|uniref:Uncharacterized protein n=1 Tax=Bacillus changyiensis TaxID=3004103 RepID=A0ABT4X611_9BACI|nr:hypothetical protein [Bacillus changyiensis]MDA7027638.1 hypothetical protein [Bacillus changyiensis]
MAEKNQQPDVETAELIERINKQVNGLGQAILELVQKNSNLDIKQMDWTKMENTELNQSIQNNINEYIQNINNLNANLLGQINDSTSGMINKNDEEQ